MTLDEFAYILFYDIETTDPNITVEETEMDITFVFKAWKNDRVCIQAKLDGLFGKGLVGISWAKIPNYSTLMVEKKLLVTL